MRPATTQNLKAAEKAVRKHGNTVHLDSGDGWVTVISWDWQRQRVIKHQLNPEGMMIL